MQEDRVYPAGQTSLCRWREPKGPMLAQVTMDGQATAPKHCLDRREEAETFSLTFSGGSLGNTGLLFRCVQEECTGFETRLPGFEFSTITLHPGLFPDPQDFVRRVGGGGSWLIGVKC